MGKIPAHLSASHAQTLEDSFTDTLLFLMEGAEDCIARYDEHGKDLKALLQMPASSHARSIADQIRGAILLENDAVASAESYPVSPDEDTTMVAAMEPLLEVETDTVAGTDTTGKPASDETGAAAPGSTTAPRVRISTFADAKIKPRYFSGGVSSDDDMSTPVEPTGPRHDGDGTLEAVKSRLDDVFHDRCVHIDVGTFWMYQFCYGLSLIQFHEQADSLVTIQLGRFLETPKSWEVVGDGPERAIVHDYSKDGAECADTGERRKALVRYLCDHSLSSDVGIRVELREPRLCQYELSVYLAELCDVLD